MSKQIIKNKIKKNKDIVLIGSFLLFLLFLTVYISAFNFPTSSVKVYNYGSGGGNITTILDLLDTPNSYVGQADKCVVVNSSETGLGFTTCGTGSGGNSSWNQSFANTLYLNRTSEASYLSTYNSTYASLVSDNASWNQSFANTLYSSIIWGYNQTTATYNLYNTIWSSTYNSTYDSKAGTGNCPAGQVVMNTTSSGVQCVDRVDPSTTYYVNSTSIVGGTITSTKLNDTYWYDGITYNISEGTGSEPLTLYVNYTNVTSFNQWILREYYLGSSSHDIQFQIWDYGSSTWENYYSIVGQSGQTWVVIPVFDSSEHISGGVVQTRLYHVQSGVSSHRLYIDVDWLINGNNIGASTNLEGYAKYSFGYNNFNGNGNLTTTGIINASIYYGDGSQLTGLGSDNSSWNQSFAYTLFLNRSSEASYLSTYNSTYDAKVSAVNDGITLNYNNLTGTVPSAWLSTYNSTYALLVTDNSSWNQSFANTLYAPIGSAGDNASWNQSFANTLYLNRTSEASYLSTYNSTYDAKVSGNSSWNQSFANTLYAPIGSAGDNSSWNESYANGLYAKYQFTNNDFNGSGNFTIKSSTTNFPFKIQGSLGGGFYFGSWDSTWGGMWSSGVNPNLTNYALLVNPTNTVLNTPTPAGTIQFYFADVGKMTYNTNGMSINSATGPTTGNGLIVSSGKTGLGTNAPDNLLTIASTGMLQSIANSTARVCNTTNEGGFYYDGTTKNYYICNSTTWNAVGSGSSSGDNSSWNQSFANTLYLNRTSEASYLSTYNSTYDAKVSDNASWNKSYADTLYAPIGVGSDNSSWNQSFANTLYLNRSSESSYLSTYNATYDSKVSAVNNGITLAYQNITGTPTCSAGQYVKMNATGWICETVTAVETEPAWNGNYSIFTGLINNASYLSTYNATYDSKVSAVNNGITLDYNNLTGTVPSAWTTTYNATYDAKVSGNSSWNQSFANTLYAPISVTGDNASWNQSFAYTLFLNRSSESSYLSTYNATYDAKVSDNASWNKSYADTLYAPISVTGDNASWNKSYADTLYANISWNYNQTTATYNLYNTVWSSTYNSTYALLVTDNSSWNQSFANTLYLNRTSEASYLSTYNATYDSKVSAVNDGITLNYKNITSTPTCSAGQYVKMNATGWICETVTVVETEPAWNGNYSIFTGLINNASYLSTYNATYASYYFGARNETLDTYNAYNTAWSSTFNSSYLVKTGDTMTGSLNMSNNNITNINYVKFNKIAGACDLTINGSICSNTTGTYIVG